MATKGIDFRFTGSATTISNYNSNLTNLGTLIQKYSGATNSDVFAGPLKIGMARPMEQSVAIAAFYPHVISISSDLDWVFLADNSTAAATRRVILYEYTRSTSTFNWLGFITITFPTATAYTIKGMRVSRELYTTGTISGTGTAITGSGTSWSSDKMSVGCRIGFGSTNPNEITTWYEISAIGSNTSITLTSSLASSLPSNTPYVIEDIIIVLATTNATATNGGLNIVKGIRKELFTNTGTAISAAASTDNIRACYWLADAATVTNTIACGSAIGPRTSWTDQRVYVLDATGPKIYIYNFRAALTLTSGKDTTTNIIKTGNQTVTGTISQTNNGRIGTLYHGPASGVSSLYFVTTTRVVRCAVSNITNSSTTWQSDVMAEIPPGGTSTYAASSVLSSCEISQDIDRLVVMSTGAAGARSYVTKYNTVSDPFDHIFLVDDKQLDQSTADSGGVQHPSIQVSIFSIWAEAGMLYLVRHATTAVSNQIYTLPIGAHQTYAFLNNQMIITPSFDISDSNKLYSVSIRYLSKLGTDTFSLPPEPFKLYYRTSGINDNSGTWIAIDESGDLSGVSGSNIQFCIIFKILGTTCVPARILGLSLVYEDNTTDSHYEPSIKNSSITNGSFAYRQKIAWNSDISDLRIRLYNVSNGTVVIDDNTSSHTYGTFEFSTDNGVTWSSWSSVQAVADAVDNYIRYTASSLPGGTKIRALLTQL